MKKESIIRTRQLAGNAFAANLRFGKLLCCGMLFWAIPALASEPALTIGQCQKMATENYPLVQQYALIDEAAGFTESNIRKTWLPQINLNAQASYQSDAPDFPADLKSLFTPFIDIEGMNKDQYKIALDINQTIWDGGMAKSGKMQTEAERIQQARNTDVQIYGLRKTVNNLFFGILLIDEHLKQNRNRQNLLEQYRAQIETYYENGIATQSDVDAIIVQCLTARRDEKHLLASRREYCHALARFIGMDTQTDSLALVRPEKQQITSLSVLNRPEMSLFDARISLLDTHKASINASVTPRISFFATGFYGNPGLNYIENMIHPGWSWNYMVGISLRWNIGGFYTRKNDMRKIRNAQAAIETERDIFIFNSAISTSRKNDKISEIEQIIIDDEKIIRYRTSIRKSAESALRNGVIDITGLLDKVTDENAAILTRSSHEIELLKTIYELKTLTNN